MKNVLSTIPLLLILVLIGLAMELWPNSSASVNSEIVLLSTDRERADLNSFPLDEIQDHFGDPQFFKNISLATLSGIPSKYPSMLSTGAAKAPADGSNK